MCQVALVVKNPSASAGDAGDVGSIPGWEDPLKEGMATHSRILACRIPWTEEPGRLESTGSQRDRPKVTLCVCVCVCVYKIIFIISCSLSTSLIIF